MCAPNTWVDANKMFVISRKTIWDLWIENGEWRVESMVFVMRFIFWIPYALHLVVMQGCVWGYEKYFYLNKYSNLMMAIPLRWTRSSHCSFLTIKFESFVAICYCYSQRQQMVFWIWWIERMLCEKSRHICSKRKLFCSICEAQMWGFFRLCFQYKFDKHMLYVKNTWFFQRTKA